uniref:RRM domain-containing protein n=1 Tax=Leucosporidium scottii TaxID=5278 RepID=A0A0H5FRT5_9BASI|nr:hypothetical protein [Leucosporidium scottii]
MLPLPRLNFQVLSTRLEETQQSTEGAAQPTTLQHAPSTHQASPTGSALTPSSDLEARMSPALMDAEQEGQEGDPRESQASVEAEAEGEDQEAAMDTGEHSSSGSSGGFKRGSFVPVEDGNGARVEEAEEMGELKEGRIVEEGEIETTVARLGAEEEVAVILKGKASSTSTVVSPSATSLKPAPPTRFAPSPPNVDTSAPLVGEGMLEYSTIAEADEALRSLNGRLLHGLTVRLER